MKKQWNPAAFRAAMAREGITAARLWDWLAAALNDENVPSLQTIYRWRRTAARGPNKRELRPICHLLKCSQRSLYQ